MIYPWQQSLWRDLYDLFATDKVPHAILLAGPGHSGLEVLARSYMQLLMCASPESAGACGSCRSCTLLAAGSHPDGFLLSPLEDSKQIIIEQIRTLVHQLTLSSIVASRKLALICPAEAMNRNSQNALLKTLEEPAGSTVIILVSNDPGRLLPTIRSRCRLFSQPLPAKPELMTWLADNHPDSDPESRQSASVAAGGKPLLALKYLEDGTLEQRRDVAVVLFRMARSGGNALEAARKFSDYPKPDLWIWISGWMGTLAAVLLNGGESDDPVVESFRKMLPCMTARKALQLQQQAMRSHQSHKGPLRQDLLLADWLIQWQSCR